jgi:hypothetical protein
MCTKFNLRTLKITDLRILDVDEKDNIKIEAGKMGCDME